jgi:hypothetical protein
LNGLALKRTTYLQSIWRYARPEFLYVAWAVMETALIAPVALTFMPWALFWTPLLFACWVLLIMLIPFNLSRLMSLRKVGIFKQQNIILLAFFVTLLLSTRLLLYSPAPAFSLAWLSELGSHFATARHPALGRDLLLFILLSIVWWRGISLANRRVDINELGLRIRIGALILAPMIILLGQFRLGWSVAGFILLFLFAGLIAIALTRAEQIEQEQTGQNYPMSPRWFAAIVATSAAIILIAWTAAALVSGESLPVFMRWLNPVGLAGVFAGTVIFTAITYLALPLLAVLERIALFINTILGREFSPEEPPPGSEDADIVAEQFDALIRWLTQPDSTLSFVINRALIFLGLLLVAALVLLLLERFFSRRRLATQDGEESGFSKRHEVDLASDGVGRRLLHRLGLLRRFRAASVRRLYYQMCRAAAAHGYPRASAETPYEYLNTLALAWPDGQEESRLITEAFVRVRYGEVPETHDELAELEAAWRKLEQLKPADMALQTH